MPPLTAPCPAPPPVRLSRRDDRSASLPSRMHNWRVETLVRRRLEHGQYFHATQDRGSEVRDHRALRAMLPPSGGYGPAVADPVALPAFVRRVGEWDGELRSFRASLLQNRQREQRVGSAGAVWAGRILEQFDALQEETMLGRATASDADEEDATDGHASQSMSVGNVVPSAAPNPDVPLYNSTAARARRSKELRDRTLAAVRLRTTNRDPAQAHLSGAQGARASARIPTVASNEETARGFWLNGRGDAPDTLGSSEHPLAEAAFRRLLSPSTAYEAQDGSRQLRNRRRARTVWYDFERAQLEAHAPQLLQPHPPSPSESSVPKTAGARVGRLTVTYPFPLF